MEKSKKKILIIDDEKLHLEMYRDRFEEADYQVLTATNGRLGLELAKKEKPDLIILDILMPEMDGYEVIKKIKEDARTKKITILVLSNLAQDDEIKRGLELGADDYIIKTDITPTELLNRVKKILNQTNEAYFNR